MAEGEDAAGPPRVARRPVRWPEDAPFLERLYASTRADELAITGWSDAQKAEFCRGQFNAQHAHYQKHYPDAAFDVIEQDGASAGRLTVDRREKEIGVVDLALLPDFRGRGIGTRLLRELASEADAAGKPLTMHVERFNPAQRLYARLGFELAEDKGIYLFLRRLPRGER